ncbi:MAG: class I SAM-dependent DNA methyltransferase [Massiliimalia sp.]|jgi:ubiquinone/menaquinone biosynthesis C-methylase UbiE
MSTNYENFAASYDELTRNVDYEARGEYFHRILRQYGKDHGILLDLACGTGTLSEYFAAQGYDVIGVDSSEEMLNLALEKKMESQSNVMYLCQQMQQLDLFGTVDIVICALDSLNHLADLEEVAQTLDRVSLFLNENGLVVFDVNTIYKHEQVLGNHTFVYDCPDVYCVWQNTLQDNHVVQIDLDLFEYDEENDCYYRSEEHFCERAYSHEELCSVLEQTGFELLAVYGDDSFDPPEETTQRAVYVLRNRFCRNHAAEE